ncbi:MAG: hypothetical protein JOZ45_01880 [Acidobacteriaceae bacterium]|nr:hypothetical protein [Acidobacteriaceae bacterium]
MYNRLVSVALCQPHQRISLPPSGRQRQMQFTKLNDVTIQQAYVTMEGYVGDNPTIGFKGMLHLYSLWLAQSKAFFRPADSTDMQNLYDYWDAALTQAANLKIELLHS